MGPLMWWWRWWLGGDPNRDRRLSEADLLLDQQRDDAEHLTALVEERDREIERLRGVVANLERARDEAEQARSRLATDAEQARADAEQARADAEQARADAERAAAETDAAATSATPDVATGSEVLGRRLALDDLTVIDGVGPKIAGVLADAGFDTWRALAAAEVERLRDVLVEANPRYRMHDPSDWPAQAALLADGRWEAFAARSQG